MSGIATKIAEGGKLVIPAELRRELGLKIGDEVIVRVEDGEFAHPFARRGSKTSTGVGAAASQRKPVAGR